jgi:hypothetical protein
MFEFPTPNVQHSCVGFVCRLKIKDQGRIGR